MMASSHFAQVAEAVTERVAALLGTRVSVVDEHGLTITSSDAGLIGLPIASLTSHHNGGGCLKFPLQFNDHTGQIIVSPSRSGEPISARLTEALVELIVNQTAVLDQLPNEHELKNKFIHDLLRGSSSDNAAMLREAQILGLDLAPPRAVILIDAADYILSPVSPTHPEGHEAHIRRAAQLVIASIVSFFDLPTDAICAYIGGGEVAVLKASSTQDLVAWTDEDQRSAPGASWANLAALRRAAQALLTRLRHDTNADLAIGIGRYHPEIRGLARSYDDARAALSLGRRIAGTNRVHCLDRLGVAAFVGVADEDTKIELAWNLLSPLDHAPELLHTLRVFFEENCTPSATATRLAIHRNTLGYRLEKIASLTGLDPRHFDDAIQIRLALVLRALDQGRVTCAPAQ